MDLEIARLKNVFIDTSKKNGKVDLNLRVPLAKAPQSDTKKS